MYQFVSPLPQMKNCLRIMICLGFFMPVGLFWFPPVSAPAGYVLVPSCLCISSLCFGSEVFLSQHSLSWSLLLLSKEGMFRSLCQQAVSWFPTFSVSAVCVLVPCYLLVRRVCFGSLLYIYVIRLCLGSQLPLCHLKEQPKYLLITLSLNLF